MIALSGPPTVVVESVLRLARDLLPGIDIERATGVHPRVGALDVAPFVDLGAEEARSAALRFARRFADEFEVPVHLYEGSADGRALPTLRRAEPGPPDFGPPEPHPRWGRTVVGARGVLIAANLDFAASARDSVRAAAREIRRLRQDGDPDLEGVRALAFDLPSRSEVQLSFNLTRPDRTNFDRVAEIAEGLVGQRAAGTELVGVIRRRDLPGATRLRAAPEQVV